MSQISSGFQMLETVCQVIPIVLSPTAVIMNSTRAIADHVVL